MSWQLAGKSDIKMSILFWLLWLLNASLAIVILYANSFKSHHGGGLDTDKMVLIGIAVILAGSLQGPPAEPPQLPSGGGT